MVSLQLVDEQREYKRFQVKRASSFVMNPQWPSMGELVDISRGGFAFNYMSGDAWPQGDGGANVIFGAHDSCLNDLHVSVVVDFALPGGLDDGKVVCRRRGVKFTELTENQRFVLDCFIWINRAPEC